jgi:hypothetical protein
MSTVQIRRPTRKPLNRLKASAPTAVSAERVRQMLREIAFVLHATRVARRVGDTVASEEELYPALADTERGLTAWTGEPTRVICPGR